MTLKKQKKPPENRVINMEIKTGGCLRGAGLVEAKWWKGINRYKPPIIKYKSWGCNT